MSTFLTDLCRLGPAPTLRREVPVSVFNVLLTAVVVGLLLRFSEAEPVLLFILGGVSLGYTAFRLIASARSRDAETR